MLNESDKGEGACYRRVKITRAVVGVTRLLVNTRSLLHEFVRMLHEDLLVHVSVYGSEAMVWMEKERPEIRGIQIHRLSASFSIGSRHNTEKGLEERIEVSILLWLGPSKE